VSVKQEARCSVCGRWWPETKEHTSYCKSCDREIIGSPYVREAVDPVVVKPPSRLRIGPFTYQVHCDAAGINRARQKMRDNERYLCAAHWQVEGEIFICPKQSPGMQRCSLLHEIQHACYDLANHPDEMTEEDAIARLAPALLDTLQRNPELRAFLFEDDG